MGMMSPNDAEVLKKHREDFYRKKALAEKKKEPALASRADTIDKEINRLQNENKAYRKKAARAPLVEQEEPTVKQHRERIKEVFGFKSDAPLSFDSFVARNKFEKDRKEFVEELLSLVDLSAPLEEVPEAVKIIREEGLLPRDEDGRIKDFPGAAFYSPTHKHVVTPALQAIADFTIGSYEAGAHNLKNMIDNLEINSEKDFSEKFKLHEKRLQQIKKRHGTKVWREESDRLSRQLKNDRRNYINKLKGVYDRNLRSYDKIKNLVNKIHGHSRGLSKGLARAGEGLSAAYLLAKTKDAIESYFNYDTQRIKDYEKN